MDEKTSFKKRDTTASGTNSGSVEKPNEEADRNDDCNSDTTIFKKYTVNINLLQIFNEKNKFYGVEKDDGRKESGKEEKDVSSSDEGIFDMLLNVRRFFFQRLKRLIAL